MCGRLLISENKPGRNASPADAGTQEDAFQSGARVCNEQGAPLAPEGTPPQEGQTLLGPPSAPPLEVENPQSGHTFHGWFVVQLDHDEETGPMHGMYGTLDAELEVQRTIKRLS